MKDEGVTVQQDAKNLYMYVTLIENITKIVIFAIVCGTVFFIFNSFFDILPSLAGKETTANILIKLITGLHLSQNLGYVVGSGGILYSGVVTHLWRKEKKKIKTLEKKITKRR